MMAVLLDTHFRDPVVASGPVVEGVN